MNPITAPSPPFVRPSGPATVALGWLARLVDTAPDAGPAIARLALGLVMFPHGAQKMLGCFGGHGFAATMGAFTGKMGIPPVFAALAIFAEFFGSIGLIVGALSRVAALGISVVMVVAVLMTHIHAGFFMNWFGNQPGEGFEYHLLAIGLALVVLVKGAGAWSLDEGVTARGLLRRGGSRGGSGAAATRVRKDAAL